MTLRLLLVEDDPRLGPLVAEVLGEEWDVTLCVDGESALVAAAARYFDAMVIDRGCRESTVRRSSRRSASAASARRC